jgi:hypothetical protein
MGFAKRLFGVFFSFWFLLTFLALAALCAALFVYRMQFGGGFSAQSGDWSAFGSYIGGILSPLISFLTLGAVLKTVYLQRELLETQKQEFVNLSHQQMASLQHQDQLLQLSRGESERALVQNYLANQFKLIDVLIAHQQRQAEAMSEAALKIMELEHGSLAQRMKAAEPALEAKDKAIDNVKNLISLSIELSVSEFKSTKEILAVVGPRLLKVIDHKPDQGETQQAAE